MANICMTFKYASARIAALSDHRKESGESLRAEFSLRVLLIFGEVNFLRDELFDYELL